MARMRAFDAVADLHRVECPTLVSVGERDPVTPVAAAREIHDALPDHLRRLDVIDGAGHFPWLDTPDRYWAVLRDFVEDSLARTAPTSDRKVEADRSVTRSGGGSLSR